MERTIKANKFLNDENICTKISTERMKMVKNMSNDIIWLRVHEHDSNHMYHCINVLPFFEHEPMSWKWQFKRIQSVNVNQSASILLFQSTDPMECLWSIQNKVNRIWFWANFFFFLLITLEIEIPHWNQYQKNKPCTLRLQYYLRSKHKLQSHFELNKYRQ